jgi:predicted transcriptional regulator of viral defense system
MSAATAYATLRSLRAPVITTGEAAAALRVSESSASRTLRTLERRGLLRRVRQGIWALDGASGDPRAIIADLTRPLPAYVSFQSALATHGAIDQIPRETTIASLGRPRRVRTTLGTYVIHRLPPELFGGFEDHNGVAMATVEKALFDYFYVAAASGHPNRRLPELDLPADFSEKDLRQWIARSPSPRLRTLVEAGVDRALRHAEYEDPRPARRVHSLVSGRP